MNLKVNDRERWIIKLVRLTAKINRGYKNGKHRHAAAVETCAYNFHATEPGFEVRLYDHDKNSFIMNYQCNDETTLQKAYKKLTERAWKGGLL